jgi:hypothetical protein
VSHLEPQQCLGWCGLLPITAGGLPTAPCFNRAMPERRFPPPWTVEEAKARRIAAKCGKAAARLAAPP